MSAAIVATGLGKKYRRRWALRDCTLEIPEGRVAALVGPNGAGKTTLLHLATGLLEPTAGSILVLGLTPGDDPAILRANATLQDNPDKIVEGRTYLIPLPQTGNTPLALAPVCARRVVQQRAVNTPGRAVR